MNFNENHGETQVPLSQGGGKQMKINASRGTSYCNENQYYCDSINISPCPFIQLDFDTRIACYYLRHLRMLCKDTMVNNGLIGTPCTS